MSEVLACARAEARRPYVLKALCAIAAALGVTIGAFMFLGGFPLFLFLVFAVCALPIARQLTTYDWQRPTVTLDEGVIHVDAHDRTPYTLRVADVREGWEHPANGSVLLRLANGHELTIVPGHRAEGERILAHAGVAPEQRAIAMPLRRTLGAFTIGLLAWFVGYVVGAFAMAAAGPAATFIFAPIFGTLVCVLAVKRLGHPRLIIGTDGVRTRGLLRQRFVPHADIERIDALHVAHDGTRGIRIGLRGGDALVLPLVALGPEHVEAIIRRIQRASESSSSGDTRRIEALARGERSIADWKRDIERIAVAPPGFRDQALGRDDFERVVADPNAPADQRIGAAMALRVADPEAARARIRIVVDAVAEEALREALLAAAEGEADDASLERVTRRRASLGRP